MAVPSTTVGDLLSELAFTIEGKSTVSESLRSIYVNALQAAQDELVRERPVVDRLRTEATVATVADTKDYALADDINEIVVRSIYLLDGTTHRYLKYIELPDAESGRYRHLLETDSGQPYAFSILGSNAAGNLEVRLHPTPDGVYTIKYRYYSWPSRFESDTDGSTILDRRIPKVFHLPLISGAVVNRFPERVKGQELQAHMAVWEKAKRQWKYERPTATLDYEVEPMTNHHRTMGRDHGENYTSGSGPTPGWG